MLGMGAGVSSPLTNHMNQAAPAATAKTKHNAQKVWGRTHQRKGA